MIYKQKLYLPSKGPYYSLTRIWWSETEALLINIFYNTYRIDELRAIWLLTKRCYNKWNSIKQLPLKLQFIFALWKKFMVPTRIWNLKFNSKSSELTELGFNFSSESHNKCLQWNINYEKLYIAHMHWTQWFDKGVPERSGKDLQLRM